MKNVERAAEELIDGLRALDLETAGKLSPLLRERAACWARLESVDAAIAALWRSQTSKACAIGRECAEHAIDPATVLEAANAAANAVTVADVHARPRFERRAAAVLERAGLPAL